jgi:hypothetical protein
MMQVQSKAKDEMQVEKQTSSKYPIFIPNSGPRFGIFSATSQQVYSHCPRSTSDIVKIPGKVLLMLEQVLALAVMQNKESIYSRRAFLGCARSISFNLKKKSP